MESISNGVEDYLIEGLSFKLSPGSSYVTDRRKSTYWASGSNIYSTSGTRVVRFMLNGEDGTWIDPSTIRIQYDLKNNETVDKKIRPLGGPHLFFRRGRLMCNSTLVEDIQDYNRFHEMMDSMKPDHVRDNIDNEGYGHRWDDQSNKHIHTWTVNSIPGIAGGSKQTVGFKPYFGLLNQSKLLPLKYAPLILEMEIVNSNLDPIITPGVDGVFTEALTGSNWSIENICIKCDCLTLDNNLNNEYTSHLLSGKALPIKYTTYINQQNSIAGNGLSVQVSRAVSRLKAAFITFYKIPTPNVVDANGDVTTYNVALEDKPAIKFYHPMAGYTGATKYYDNSKELEIQLQLGPKLYPEYPCKSVSEAFTILKQTLNLPDWNLHSVGIDYRQYISNKFIYGMSFEKVPESSWTGTSTKSGQIMLIKCSTDNGSSTATIADQMYITLVSEQILEIRDVGVSVFD